MDGGKDGSMQANWGGLMPRSISMSNIIGKDGRVGGRIRADR